MPLFSSIRPLEKAIFESGGAGLESTVAPTKWEQGEEVVTYAVLMWFALQRQCGREQSATATMQLYLHM